jgi:hypothetical protein
MRLNVSEDSAGPSDRHQERTLVHHCLRRRAHCREAVAKGERLNYQHHAFEDAAKLQSRPTARTPIRCSVPRLPTTYFRIGSRRCANNWSPGACAIRLRDVRCRRSSRSRPCHGKAYPGRIDVEENLRHSGSVSASTGNRGYVRR